MARIVTGNPGAADKIGSDWTDLYRHFPFDVVAFRRFGQSRARQASGDRAKISKECPHLVALPRNSERMPDFNIWLASAQTDRFHVAYCRFIRMCGGCARCGTRRCCLSAPGADRTERTARDR